VTTHQGPDQSGRPMQIGEIAERTGMSLRTLRHYDEIGLLTPSLRSDGGYRLYTADDLARLLVIRRMKPLGYTLEDMQQVMDAIQLGAAVDPMRWSALLGEAEQRRAALAEKVAMADEFVALLRERAKPVS
jgi:MerR family transcriptional regulator, copper efflux regulator